MIFKWVSLENIKDYNIAVEREKEYLEKTKKYKNGKKLVNRKKV